MLSSTRIARLSGPRAVRCTRQLPRQQARFQSSTSGSGKPASHFASGLAGGLVGATVFYGIYSFTPAGQTASKLNKAALEANKQYKIAAEKLQSSAPDPDQAIESIKQFAYYYAGFLPGGRAYVDTAFKDLELVREKNKEEADKIIQDGQKQFKEIAKGGLSLETASKAYEALAELSKRVANLSGDAISDIVDNHPQLKEKLGGNIDKLKSMGEQYGPEAKRQVDETWGQVKDIFASGFSVASFDKAKKLIDDKVQQVQELGDNAWKKAMEEAKPYLDKNPKIRELIEKNTDALKQGNFKDLFNKARKAADSGDLGGLQDYVNDVAKKAKSKGSEMTGGMDFSKYLSMIPQGDEIIPKLQEIRKLADEHKEDGEKLLKETIEEIKKVLEKKSQEAQDVVKSKQNKGK